jgi:hypothetical protein
MKLQTTKSKVTSFIPPNPVPHILITQTGSKRWKKWKGCIYISSYDHTGEVFMFLREIRRTSSGLFLKNPIFVFISKDKTDVETQISEKMISLLKS